MRQHTLMTRRRLVRLACAAAGLHAPEPVSTARAQQVADPQIVDLLLVLAVDASGSVSLSRFELQRHGYAAAFRHRLVQKAIAAGVQGRIAVAMVQWTGPALQVPVVPWTVLATETSCLDFSAAIQAAPRQLFGGGTSISGAIDYSSALLAAAPFNAHRRVIDVSGDGPNNRGRPVQQARDDAVGRGITINGLPILELEPDLDEHYKTSVIGGPNAFLVVARTFEEFAEAILKKLVTEIADLPAGAHPPA